MTRIVRARINNVERASFMSLTLNYLCYIILSILKKTGWPLSRRLDDVKIKTTSIQTLTSTSPPLTSRYSIEALTLFHSPNPKTHQRPFLSHVLPIYCNCCIKIVNKILFWFLKSNNILSSSQYGFQKGRRTLQTLTNLNPKSKKPYFLSFNLTPFSSTSKKHFPLFGGNTHAPNCMPTFLFLPLAYPERRLQIKMVFPSITPNFTPYSSTQKKPFPTFGDIKYFSDLNFIN